MQRTKKYDRVVFDSNSIEKIFEEFQKLVKDPSKTRTSSLKISRLNEDWNYDNLEEFLAELRNGFNYFRIRILSEELALSISNWHINIAFPSECEIESESRNNIIRLGNYIDAIADDLYIPLPSQPEIIPAKPKIFIGHGSTSQWRDLKDHLQDQHGYDVVCYETGSRAGHTIRDVITELLRTSSFAILVMTGENKMEDGKVLARQNVIHEIGLFQGRLGFTKAIVLLEEGTEEFSNIHGVQQIRYSKGNVKETFGDVLAALNKEFGLRR